MSAQKIQECYAHGYSGEGKGLRRRTGALDRVASHRAMIVLYQKAYTMARGSKTPQFVPDSNVVLSAETAQPCLPLPESVLAQMLANDLPLYPTNAKITTTTLTEVAADIASQYFSTSTNPKPSRNQMDDYRHMAQHRSVELFAGRYLRFFVAGCCTLQGDVIWRGLSIGYDRAQGSLVGLIATESAVEFTDQNLLISEVAALSLMMALQLHPDHNNGLASLTALVINITHTSIRVIQGELGGAHDSTLQIAVLEDMEHCLATHPKHRLTNQWTSCAACQKALRWLHFCQPPDNTDTGLELRGSISGVQNSDSDASTTPSLVHWSDPSVSDSTDRECDVEEDVMPIHHKV